MSTARSITLLAATTVAVSRNAAGQSTPASAPSSYGTRPVAGAGAANSNLASPADCEDRKAANFAECKRIGSEFPERSARSKQRAGESAQSCTTEGTGQLERVVAGGLQRCQVRRPCRMQGDGKHVFSGRAKALGVEDR